MGKRQVFIVALILMILSCNKPYTNKVTIIEHENIVSYVVNPKNQQLKFYWKDSKAKNYKNIQSLKMALKKQHKRLVFAMNGGMFNKDLSPKGLYIEKKKVLSKLDTLTNGYGNFYMQPNGVFYLTKNGSTTICTSKDFRIYHEIEYATQSGPMLIIDGEFHPKFRKDSKNVHIRNGVGILPNGNLLFAMSKQKINFYNFADFFKKNGCQNALYLDGFVSKTYLPSKNWEQLDGNFAVIIALEEKI